MPPLTAERTAAALRMSEAVARAALHSGETHLANTADEMALFALLALAGRMGAFGRAVAAGLSLHQAIAASGPAGDIAPHLLVQIAEQVHFNRVAYEFRVDRHHFSAAAFKPLIDETRAIVGERLYVPDREFALVLLRALDPATRDTAIDILAVDTQAQDGRLVFFTRMPTPSERIEIKRRFTAARQPAVSLAPTVAAVLATLAYHVAERVSLPGKPASAMGMPALKGVGSGPVVSSSPLASGHVVDARLSRASVPAETRALVDAAEAAYVQDEAARAEAAALHTTSRETKAVAARTSRAQSRRSGENGTTEDEDDSVSIPSELLAIRRRTSPQSSASSSATSLPIVTSSSSSQPLSSIPEDKDKDEDEDLFDSDDEGWADGEAFDASTCQPLAAPTSFDAAIMRSELVTSLARTLGFPVPFVSASEARSVAKILLIVVLDPVSAMSTLREHFGQNAKMSAHIARLVPNLTEWHAKASLHDVRMLLEPFRGASTPLPPSLRSFVRTMPPAMESVRDAWRHNALLCAATLFWGGGLESWLVSHTLEPATFAVRPDVLLYLRAFKEARHGVMPDDVRRELVCRFPR